MPSLKFMGLNAHMPKAPTVGSRGGIFPYMAGSNNLRLLSDIFSPLTLYHIPRLVGYAYFLCIIFQKSFLDTRLK